MSAFSSNNAVPNEVSALLSGEGANQGLEDLLTALLASCREIADAMRNGTFSHDNVGTTNAFGDVQLEADLEADAIIFKYLKLSGLVHIGSSEENPTEQLCDHTTGPGFSVAFDPLDGSSIVGANFAVGTIIAVFPGNGLLGRCGNEQSLSIMVQYGPRVTAALAINRSASNVGELHCMELTMLPDRWVVSKANFTIAANTKIFAPGNLRATSDNESYNALVQHWITKKYTLRYSGGLVPDVYHILAKGQGVFSNASSKTAKAKLRLLYECAPIGLIVEAAGGKSLVAPCEAMQSIEPVSVLDVVISDLDKRVGVCYGSEEEVHRFQAHIYGSMV